ncbi:MAG: CTP synthase [Candidatus Zambryskibacteria bacterium RIFCSPHIGHO2_01_FULL_43_27]|nr:MAG: CTP synthase [Candidatus Zambryskibacteria bacterium RIFCSPHIGHO2_01_FULL_43_27]
MKHRKYIFVVGGVMSGVGKGIASSSIAKILQAKGFRVTALKIDPYINVDAGTMNPTEHGEVFVLDDGDETDQDMGNYERFLDVDLSRVNYMTTGRVYEEVIRKERNLEYKGKNVEVVPDIPLEVIERIEKAADKARADITVIEIGGTVGEYQNIIFLEAARMLKSKHHGDVAFVMVSYLPVPSKIGEMKTKPTQYASRTLNSAGVQADVIIARSEAPLDQKRKEKIAVFCNISADRVISAPDVNSIYDVPINFEKDHLGENLLEVLNLPSRRKTNLKEWTKFVKKTKNGKKVINIAVVGKYFDSGSFVLSDVYISVLEALKFSAYANNVKPKLTYINSKDIENKKFKVAELSKYDGLLVPGGFGEAGVEGIIMAIRYARERKMPFFGLCYGMQLAVIEFSRNVCGWKDSHTTEISKSTKHPVIDVMPEQKTYLANGKFGATMRLGAYTAILKKGSLAYKSYGSNQISERHRHRYEVNPEYIALIEDKGLIFSGKSKDGRLCEIAELPARVHPFFLGTQFHPEFKARPLKPHKLFTAFIRATIKHSRKK